MTHEEAQIWQLVHEWCNEQLCDIPDFNRRVLMDKILALRQPPVSSSACPDCLMGRDDFEPNWKCPACRQTDH